MRNSWLGIANHHGLRCLLPEQPHLARFLRRRAHREQSVCFWVVLDDTHAQAIRGPLSTGQSALALTLLEQLATDGGRILPIDDSPEDQAPT